MVYRSESGNVFSARCDGYLAPLTFALIPILSHVVERTGECERSRCAIYPYGKRQGVARRYRLVRAAHVIGQWRTSSHLSMSG